MNYNIDFMKPEQRAVLEGLRYKHKIVSEFVSMWTLWHNWETNLPLVVTTGNIVVGLYAYSETITGYVNSYFIWIDNDHQGNRLAGELVDVMLENHKSKRLKTRVAAGKDGYRFWTGFGVDAIGMILTKDEMLFDFSIVDVHSVADLIKYAKDLNTLTFDKRSLGHYKKLGVKFTSPAWEHLNDI